MAIFDLVVALNFDLTTSKSNLVPYYSYVAN